MKRAAQYGAGAVVLDEPAPTCKTAASRFPGRRRHGSDHRGAGVFAAQLTRHRHHRFQCLRHLRPRTRFQAAIGIDPDLLGPQNLQRALRDTTGMVKFLATSGTRGEWMSYTPGPISLG